MELEGRASAAMRLSSISDGPRTTSAPGGEQVGPVQQDRHDHPHPHQRGEARLELDRQRSPARQQDEVGQRPDGDRQRAQRGERVHRQSTRRVVGEQPGDRARRAAGRARQAREALEEADRERQAVEAQQRDGEAAQKADDAEDRAQRGRAGPRADADRRTTPCERFRPGVVAHRTWLARLARAPANSRIAPTQQQQNSSTGSSTAAAALPWPMRCAAASPITASTSVHTGWTICPQKGTTSTRLVACAKHTTRNVASKPFVTPPSSSSMTWRMAAVRKMPIATNTQPNTTWATKPAQLSTQPRSAVSSGRSPKAPREEPTIERKIAW